jgi:hypothetical protein
VNNDEKVPVRVVAIDTAYGRDDPDRRFANGASVVENTPAGAVDDTRSRSSLAVHAVPDVAGRLKTANASLPPAPPRIKVPKSTVSDVVVAAEANEPTAWSRTVVETVPLNVGFMACRLDAVTLTVPLRRPASVVLRVSRCVAPAPRAASLPVPLDAKPPVPAKAYWSRSAPAATATGDAPVAVGAHRRRVVVDASVVGFPIHRGVGDDDAPAHGFGQPSAASIGGQHHRSQRW